MFGSLNDALRGQRLASGDEVTYELRMWLRSLEKTFFANEIRRLVNRYILYTEKEVGDYIDK